MAKGFRRLFANYGKDRNGYKARQGMVGRTSCSHRLDIPSIPSSVWIEYIFPFLDRHCQNQLCVASRDVYEGIKILGVEQPWPQGKFRVGIVLAVAFSPRGEELAFVTANSRSVTIWNRQRGFEQTLNGHRGQCSNVAYAPSNEYLVSCSRNDGSVRLWRKEQRDNDEICQKYVNYRTLKIQVFATLFVRVSSDSKDIASFGGDGKIYVSNADDGSLRASTYWRSRLFIDCCDCVAFSSRRYAILAHTFNNQTVRLWNYQNRTSVELEDYDNTRIADYAAYITSIKFVETTIFDGSTEDSNQEYLIVGCRVATIKIWDISTYTCVHHIRLGSGWSAVTHLVFSKEGEKFACTGGGSNIRIFSVWNGELYRFENHKDRINTLSFGPGVLASGSSDRTLRLWTVPQTRSVAV